MDCREARQLLAHGIIPGTSSSEQAALGFHIVGCSACRDYRATLNADLLADLLGEQIPPVPPSKPTHTPNVAPVSPMRARDRSRPQRSIAGLFSQAFWLAGMTALALIGLTIIITLGSMALSIVRIHQNVQAMIIPTPSSTPTAPPTPTALPTVTSTPLPPQATLRPSPTPPPSATPTTTPPTAGEAMTVLLLGSDHRPGERDPARTDAIILARIDPSRQRVAFLSLPRDLWVEIPGYGSARINAAHVWGTVYSEPGGGVALARKTISTLLDIPIDYTVIIDFEHFIGAIDALGGITVDVEKELYDPQFPTMDYGYTVAHFLRGPQQMDGATALMYSRIRHPDSDFARMRRQQAVLVGVLATIRAQRIQESLRRIEALTTALRDYVQTDIPEERLIGAAWALRTLTPDQIEHYTLNETMVTFGVGNDRYAEVARDGAIEQLVAQLLGYDAP